MKIQKQLLESLIRVCAKEVLAQLNEGKKKSKKCKCGKSLILGANQCKECLEESGLTSEGKSKGRKKGGSLVDVSNERHTGTTSMTNHQDDPTTPEIKESSEAGDTISDTEEMRHKGKKSMINTQNDSTTPEIKEEDSETIGAPQAGSGESVDIETTPPEIENEPSEKETPKKKEKLQGIVLLTPSGELRQVPFRQWADESSIERTLHKVGASIGGNKVKIAISTMKKVRLGMSDKTPTYVFLGKYDPNGEELFVMADRDLNSAKEQAAKPEEIGIQSDVGDITNKQNTDNEINNDDELLAKHIGGADRPNIDAEIGYDDSESGQD